MATERSGNSQHRSGQSEPRRRKRAAVRTGVIAAVMVAAVARPAAAKVVANVPSGHRVFAASFSGGQLHETLAFHKAGQFVAHILSNPPAHPSAASRLRGRTVGLGQHAAGRTRISFRIGKLNAGRYAVVITPQPQTLSDHPGLAATWVYLMVHNNGKITNITLIQP